MKAQLRIPTNESYAYIEVSAEGTEEEIIAQYHKLTNAVKGGFGLEKKEWNAAIDEYLNTSSLVNGTEIYAQMNVEQQSCFQEIKKSLKRIEAKNSK